MSFNETLLLEHILVNLGYPSVFFDQFRIEPRFDIMADILSWLLGKIDPSIQLKKSIFSAKDRENYFKSAMSQLYLKVPGLAVVNPKALYASDIGSIRELLKIAKYVNKCFHSVEEPLKPHTAAYNKTDVNLVRAQCNNLTNNATQLYQQLDKDVDLSKIRNTVLMDSIDLSKMSSHIIDETLKLKNINISLDSELKGCLQESENIKSKLANKTAEVERREERLKSLQQIRPTYMDEYEKLTEELQVLYSEYVVKSKNIGWLEMKYNENVNIEIDNESSSYSNKNNTEEINDLLIENFKSDDLNDEILDVLNIKETIHEDDEEESLF